MSDFSDLKRDCRHVRWDRPCQPHKLRGKVCGTCDEYDPVRSRVLVVKLAAVGDVLRTTSMLPAIRRRHPGARITWVTAPAAVDLFGGNDLVDEVLSTGDAVTAARLRTARFDAVYCPDADPAAAVLAAAADAAHRFGFTADESGGVLPLGAGAGHWFRMGLSDPLKKANRRTYQELVAEALELDPAAVGRPILEPSAGDRRAAREFRAGLGHPGRLIGLNTGAGGRWAYKQWTLEHQREFVARMAARRIGVLLLGGPEEVERHRQILDSAAGLPVFDAGNHNSYRRFAALVELCSALVTGDTLAVHVAAARGVPAVVLFGPTSSAEIELYGSGEKVLPPQMDCLCCYLPVCDVRPHCQARILPEAVEAAVVRQLGAASPGS